RLEPRVAAAAAPAAGHDHRFLRLHQVGDVLARGLVFDRGARRHLDDQIFAPLAVAVGALAVSPVFRPVMCFVAKVDERAQTRLHLQDDVAAPAAVAAVGPAHRHVFFPAKTDDAVAAVAGLDVDPRTVARQRSAAAPFKNRRRLPPAGTAPFIHTKLAHPTGVRLYAVTGSA